MMCLKLFNNNRISMRIGMIVFYIVIFQMTVFAQDTSLALSGVTRDAAGETLIGVTVYNQSTQRGVVTSLDGGFSITGKTGDLIQFSYVGFTTIDYAFKGENNAIIVMEEDSREIDEVVVVGYSSQKKSSISGAVSTVNIKDMDKRRVANVAQALQGQISGVYISQSTGAPGDGISMTIRGEGTIGNNSPLYIIDGAPSKNMSFLNPSDISSITVLKDASAAAIYGSRASGGVVIITTKKGTKGDGVIELNYYAGIQNAINLPDMLNTSQYLDLKETAWNNAGYEGRQNPYTLDKTRTDLADTDWVDELFTTGKTQSVQATISGGANNMNYLISAGYVNQNGIIVYDNDKYSRFNLRSNVGAKYFDRLSIGANVQLAYAVQDRFNSKGEEPGVIRHAMLRPPVLGVYKDVNDPTYNPDDPFTDLPFYKHSDISTGGWDENYELTSNPIALAHYTDDKQMNYTTFGNIFAEYSFLKDNSLKFRTNLGVDLNMYHSKTFRLNFGDDNGGGSEADSGLGRQNRPNSLNENRGESLTFTWNNTISYVKQINKHSINAVAGTEFITNYDSSIGASRQRFDYIDETFRYLDFGSSDTELWNSGSAAEWALMSLFSSATYVYDNRYMLTGTIRADASSRFAENNAWGFFPSISGGWKLSEEDFFEDTSWLSDLKVRGSWGLLGNQEITNYAYVTILDTEGDVSRYGNPDLKWETSEQWNIGFDLGLWRNKLYITTDYFVKTTTDILLPISLPSLVGNVGTTIVNAGTVRNKGFEFALTYRDKIGKFSYSVNGNFAIINNEVLKLHPNLPIMEGTVSRTVVGMPMNSFYGYVMDGIYQNEAEIADHQYGSEVTTTQPGDIRFKDLDGNGKIDDNDRTFLGSALPDITYGLTLNGNYKGFNLSLLFQGVKGVDRYNNLNQILNYDSRPFNSTTAALGYWNGEGSSNTTPRPSFTDNGGSKVSSIFVEDASYFRLKNVEIGYSFADLLKNKALPFSDLRVYISAENLFTATSYTGLDPETTDAIDYGTYPQSRTFLMGINVKF